MRQILHCDCDHCCLGPEVVKVHSVQCVFPAHTREKMRIDARRHDLDMRREWGFRMLKSYASKEINDRAQLGLALASWDMSSQKEFSYF